MRRPARRTPNGCRTRSLSAGTGSVGGVSAAASDRRRVAPTGIDRGHDRSDPIVRQGPSHWWSHMSRSDQRIEVAIAAGVAHGRQSARERVGPQPRGDCPSSACSGTQRRSHSQIDSRTGHSDLLRGVTRYSDRVGFVWYAWRSSSPSLGQCAQPARQHRIGDRQPRHEFAVSRRPQQGRWMTSSVHSSPRRPSIRPTAFAHQIASPTGRSPWLRFRIDATGAARTPAPMWSGCRSRSVPAARSCTPGRRRPARRRTPGSTRRRRSCRWSA